ncbi:MAG: 3-methyl-2-oxobutanoate hydroxymethyltransferase [Burkholderiales bacterium]|uniref:3-methyl-2-oxobutanoate hydroxymethyltransferase n=1 Tax=uncultured Turicimonas sp. TaxID=1918607 RepID=UPI001EBA953D|nr:3-methyl-2-oxobutanoate hydroxymethyltransferase [uncultured Turicimonas sp.]MBS4847153.1 3-methyl-2-oxobutanoate hydroxymethyltransferase [Burkholderiales bacterium]
MTDQKEPRKQVRLSTLKKMHENGEPIVMLTCYDASFAHLLDEAGVDMLLVGDSLGMTVQGNSTTIPVSVEDMEYHTRCVAKGNKTAFILTDLPFGSYQVNEEEGMANCIRLIKAGANMVKLEGGEEICPLVRRLTAAGVPVCGHIGFTPQSINTIGGFFVQGKSDSGKEKLKREALALQEAGAAMVLFEMVPADIAAEVTQLLHVPTIGIGAGPGTSGQVLVLQDILNIYAGRKPKFSKNFMEGAGSIQGAVENYVKAVKSKDFPTQSHSF